MSDSEHAARARAFREDLVSVGECRAIRALDRDDDYTRSEIAFMFELQVRTVAHHADRECHHQQLRSDGPTIHREYHDSALLDAVRQVFDRQPYDELTTTVYDATRPDDFPTAMTIVRRFGSWQAALERAFGGDDDE